MSRRSWLCACPSHGFTLIEVIGALVIFSVGVLMVVQTSAAAGMRMRYAGARSQLVVFANERLDSLESEPFTALTPGTFFDTLDSEGMRFQSTVTITTVSPVLRRIDVSIVPLGPGGPSHAVTSYASAIW